MDGEYERWLSDARLRPGALLRLVCLPHAGGGASAFHGWQALLGPDVDVCAVQLPGRENRLAEARFSRLEPLLAALARVLAPALTLPFALFGHSMGALVAFELARTLRSTGWPDPVCLFVAGREAPHLSNRHRALHALSDDELVARLREIDGTPEDVLRNRELLGLMLPLLRADLAVCDTYEYRPGPPLECPISAFGGHDDLAVPSRDLAAWGTHTTSAFRLHMLDGGHFFVRTSQRALVERVRRDLASLCRPQSV